MPDWTYQTTFKPVLLRLPYVNARRLALGLMGTLGRLPLGAKVIDFFGHMRPAVCLETSCRGIRFQSRVGLGDGVDPHLTASEALGKFGFGFFDIGPMVADSQGISQVSIVVDAAQEEICLAGRAEVISRQQVVDWFRRGRNGELPVILRIAPGSCSDEWPWQLANEVVGCPVVLAWFAEELLNASECERARATADHSRYHASHSCRSLLIVPATLNDEMVKRIAELINANLYDGVLVDGSYDTEDRARKLGKRAFNNVRTATRSWHNHLGDSGWIVSAGGIHAPWQALVLLDEGANLIEIDSGLVFAGPGLPKRINEAIERRQQGCLPSPAEDEPHAPNLRDATLPGPCRTILEIAA